MGDSVSRARDVVKEGVERLCKESECNMELVIEALSPRAGGQEALTLPGSSHATQLSINSKLLNSKIRRALLGGLDDCNLGKQRCRQVYPNVSKKHRCATGSRGRTR